MLDIHIDDVKARVASVECDAFEYLPTSFRPAPWESVYEEALLGRVSPYLSEVIELLKQHGCELSESSLIQCGDWHGNRCVLHLMPHDLFVKPKTEGAELLVYRIIHVTLNQRISVESIVSFERRGEFIIQRAIGNRGNNLDWSAAGAVLGIIFMLGMTDLNAENLRVVNGVPIPIDVECAFDYNYYQPESRETLIRRLRLQAKALVMNVFPDTIVCEQELSGGEFIEGFCRGAIKARELLNLELLADTEKIDRLMLRRVLLPTPVYINYMSRGALFRWTDEYAREQWISSRIDSVDRRVAEAEVLAMLGGNIPFFHQVGTTLIDGSNGEVLYEINESASEYARKWVASWDDQAVKKLSEELSI